jgi:hypothetical protein
MWLPWSLCYLWGNRMIRFRISDCPVCLPSLLLADTSVMAISYMVASVAKTSSWSWPSRVEVHWRQSPWTVPPRPRCTRRIHHRQKPPRPKHWWLNQEVRRQMMLLLTMIPTFSIWLRWCPELVAGRASYRRSTGLIQENRMVQFS